MYLARNIKKVFQIFSNGSLPRQTGEFSDHLPSFWHWILDVPFRTYPSLHVNSTTAPNLDPFSVTYAFAGIGGKPQVMAVEKSMLCYLFVRHHDMYLARNIKNEFLKSSLFGPYQDKQVRSVTISHPSGTEYWMCHLEYIHPCM